MEITWLGQAGLLLEEDGVQVLVDPYLSDSVAKIQPKNARRKPVDPSFLEIDPDVLIFTHDHLDHLDPETAAVYLERRRKAITVLSPPSVWSKAREYQNGHNYVQFRKGTRWTEGPFCFTAHPACHSDPDAIGVMIETKKDGKRFYITGDTLYHEEIFGAMTAPPDVVFLPINGVGNNMNAVDAASFAKRLGAKRAVPLHFGLFDELDPRIFSYEGRVIPEIYQKIKWDEE